MFDQCNTLNGPRRLLSEAVLPDDYLLAEEINKKVDEFNIIYG